MNQAPTQPSEPKKTAGSLDELRTITQRWLSQFNVAFALMSIIPLLICCYLITVKFFSLSILAGMNGVYFLLAVVMALLGLLAGRRVIQTIIARLVQLNTRLEKFQTMQAEFVSQVAHELRSPLAIMKGAIDNLKDGLYGNLTGEQLEPIAMSDREITRLRRLVGDLLDVGQIESGKLRIKQEPVVMQELLEGVTTSCRGLSDQRGLRLELDRPKEPVQVLGDTDRLSQVFMNLVTNAIKFTEQGGVQVRLTQNGGTSKVEVADTGRGIDHQDLKRVFEKFERVGSRKGEGSGLGLPIAKAIVELHHGRIWVESQVDHGTHFFVQLPTQPPRKAP